LDNLPTFQSVRDKKDYQSGLDEFTSQSTLAIKRWSFTCACIVYLAFTVMDYYRFEPSVHQITILVRIVFVLIPLAVLVFLFWSSEIKSRRTYLGLSLYAYFSAGVVHIFVFSLARTYDVNLSELGFVLLILFGCLMTTMPIKPTAIISAALLAIIMLVYPMVGWSYPEVIFQCFIYACIMAMCLLINKSIIGQLAENYQMIHQLYGDSITDRLTGLKNSRYFGKQLLLLIDKARIEFKEVSLIVVDVDNFKDINDRFGHAYGDDCLINLAEVLVRRCDGDQNYAVRLSGDEFAIVMYDAKPEELTQACRDILTDIQLIDLEVSIGTSMSQIEEGENSVEIKEKLFKDADAAMYQAKRKGRNTFVSAPSLR
jgi:diguanylate cyclase (GGDEF)-like protein